MGEYNPNSRAQKSACGLFLTFFIGCIIPAKKRFTYDITSGEDGEVEVPGLDVSLGIVSAGAVLKYKFDVNNDANGETSLNVK